MSTGPETKTKWRVLDPEAGILACEYSFSKNATANSFAARMADGTMLVVSPPARPTEGHFEELEKFGAIGALAVNNGFHHLGLGPWKARYPKARSFADELAAARIAKRSKDAPSLESTDALRELLGDDVGFTSVPKTRCGESWTWARGPGGTFWYTSDVLCNMAVVPGNFALRAFFKLTGTKPGLAVFGTAMRFIVKDRKGALELLADQMRERPPTAIVPGHGAVLLDTDIAERAQKAIAAG